MRRSVLEHLVGWAVDSLFFIEKSYIKGVWLELAVILIERIGAVVVTGI